MSEEALSVGPYRVTLDDLRAMQRVMAHPRGNAAMAWFRHICSMIGFIVLFMVTCSAILAPFGAFQSVLKPGGTALIMGFLGGVAHEVLVSMVWRPAELARAFRTIWEGRDLSVAISVVQVEFRFGRRVTTIPWSDVESVTTNGSFIFLLVGSPSVIPVPARAFATAEDMKHFADHARQWFAATTHAAGIEGARTR